MLRKIMKAFLCLFVTLVIRDVTEAAEPRMLCYYDTIAATRDGVAKFTAADMEEALKFCTHIIYGYASIVPNTFEVKSLGQQQDQEFSQVRKFKQKHPNVKFLLSIGGDRDLKTPKKYVELLETSYQNQQRFAVTAMDMLKKYNFDGLDLAYQLPKTKPKTKSVEVLKKLKRQFSGELFEDTKKTNLKKQFADLLHLLKATLKTNNYMLTLTVLPNVNAELYFDMPVIIKDLDYVTLTGFDFNTPDRNPDEADFASPIRGPPAKGNRIASANLESQVNLWLAQRVPRDKVNAGAATWGRAWKLSAKATVTGEPIISNAKGPAPEGPQSKTPGLLSWPEVCVKFREPANRKEKAPLRRVDDISRKYGNYAYSIADKNGNNGVWISYEEPKTASYKAWMVRNRHLGGAALFDIGLDDLRGVCADGQFPILRAMKYELLDVKSKL